MALRPMPASASAMTGDRGRRAGLSLVETLVALVILAVVLLPLILGFTQALVTTNQSSITAAAANIARETMEELKQVDYGYLVSREREERPMGSHASFFEVQVEVTVVRDDPVAGLKRVTVSVYRTGSSTPVTMLTSYFTPRGV